MGEKSKEKQWYRINEDVEYSTHFKFFLDNQINIVKSGTIHKFISRLESKLFLRITCPYSSGDYPQGDILAFCSKIHTEILTGKHGEGELVK
ncbi:MAG TPA: hypothetical protein VIH28_07000 [Ignavibacteriaceae bacterium]